jgi:hypothetical protein
VAVDFIKANPGLTLKRTLAKAAVFWNPHYGDQFVMIILFFAGVFRFFRRRPPREWMRDAVGLWIIGVPLAFMTIHSVFHTEFRYILPVWPYLGLVAAHGLAGWRREIVGEPVPSENSIRRESG